MSENLSAFLYLVASVCFILSLRGLSSPETARNGNILGMVGMAIAILTTLASPEVVSYTTIIVGILLGGAIGTVIALKIKMTALPQLVAAFHSLVGLAAVFVAAAALYRHSIAAPIPRSLSGIADRCLVVVVLLYSLPYCTSSSSLSATLCNHMQLRNFS